MAQIDGRQVLRFRDGHHVFEVYEMNGLTGPDAFVGFCDGERSVTGDRADVVARGLQKKHVTGLPEGALVDFAKARARLKGQ